MTLAALAVALLVSLAPPLAAGADADAPAEQITWAVHTTLVPTYFDPAETTIITSLSLERIRAAERALTPAALRATLRQRRHASQETTR